MDEPVVPAVLVDTSVIIDFLRKQQKTKTLLFELIDSHRLCISVITAFEVKVGIVSERQQQDYARLTAACEILSLDEFCIDHASRLYRELRQRNALIGLPDLLIAATAVRYGIPIATFNTKHFARISELSVISPE